MKIGLVVGKEMDSVYRILGKYRHEVYNKNGKKILKFKNSYLNRFPYGYELGVCPCKIGTVSSASSTQFLIDNYSPDLIVNFGMAHRLAPLQSTATIYAVKNVIHYDFDVSEAREMHIPGVYPEYRDCHISANNRYLKRVLAMNDPVVPAVTCASGDRFIASKSAKNSLLQTFNTAEICDMSSAGVLLTAIENETFCLILKGLTDGVHNGTTLDDYYFNKNSEACLLETLFILNSLASH